MNLGCKQTLMLKRAINTAPASQYGYRRKFSDIFEPLASAVIVLIEIPSLGVRQSRRIQVELGHFLALEFFNDVAAIEH